MKSKSNFIKIDEPRILDNRLVLSKLSFSKSIGKYFNSTLFYVEYDKGIQNVASGILQIPVFCSIITVAWATSADVYIKELDGSYLESLGKIKSVMKRWYPKLSFATEIHVENVVSNKFSNRGYGLLFSGGLDATASYIKHKDKKPNLIMLWGTDIPLSKEDFWKKVKNTYEDFARQEGVEIDFIKTNLFEFLNQKWLDADFGRYVTGSWWDGFHHGIGTLGLCAPLTVVKDIGTLLIASSLTHEFKYPMGSHPLIDNNLSWGDVKIIHDAHNTSRQEKIKVLKNYITNEKYYPNLRTCFHSFSDFNCGKCEKCCRTITGLVLENINPEKCGFSMDDNFFDFVKTSLLKTRGGLIKGYTKAFLWNDIKRHIPKEMTHNLHNSKEFFNWLRNFNVSKNVEEGKINITPYLSDIYNKLPKNAQTVLDKLKPIARELLFSS